MVAPSWGLLGRERCNSWSGCSVPMWNGRPAWLVTREQLAGLSDTAVCPMCGGPNAAHYRVPTPAKAVDTTVLLCPAPEDIAKFTAMVKATRPMPAVLPREFALRDENRKRQVVFQALKQQLERAGVQNTERLDPNLVPDGGVSRSAVDMGLLMSPGERTQLEESLSVSSSDQRAWERRRLAIVNVVERFNRENLDDGVRYQWDESRQSVVRIEERKSKGGGFRAREAKQSEIARRAIDRLYSEMQESARRNERVREQQDARLKELREVEARQSTTITVGSAGPQQRSDKPAVQPAKRKRGFDFE